MISFSVPLVLASRSPRRRRLLEGLGLSFSVSPTDVDETLPKGKTPGEAVEVLARRKAAAHPRSEVLVLAADTIVVLDGAVLGKPKDDQEAREMLHALSGRTHQVYTGIAVSYEERSTSAHEVTDVTFSALTDAEITRYVETGSPMDKAGAYGIQDDGGALFVSRIEGDYYNVVGLPLHRFYALIKESFSDLRESKA